MGEWCPQVKEGIGQSVGLRTSSELGIGADPAARGRRARSAPRHDPVGDLDVSDRSVITLYFLRSTGLARACTREFAA